LLDFTHCAISDIMNRSSDAYFAISLFLALFAGFSVSASSFAGVSQEGELQRQVESQLANPVSLTAQELGTVQGKQYIFVDGFLGELFKSNFVPAVNLIQKDWQDSDTVVIRPSTRDAIWDGAESLYTQIKTIRASAAMNSPGKEAVIIAHSKGGAEITLMILRHPDVIAQMGITRVAIIAAPIGGTNLVDIVQSHSSFEDPISLYFDKMIPSLHSFLPEVLRPVFADALSKLSIEEKITLKKSFFYVRLQMSDTDLTSPLYFGHTYMSLLHFGDGPNDGLIPTENEKLIDEDGEVFGTDLGVMNGDHNSLLSNSPFKKTVNYRQTFFETLIRDILF
jgi:hypothetical protein